MENQGVKQGGKSEAAKMKDNHNKKAKRQTGKMLLRELSQLVVRMRERSGQPKQVEDKLIPLLQSINDQVRKCVEADPPCAQSTASSSWGAAGSRPACSPPLCLGLDESFRDIMMSSPTYGTLLVSLEDWIVLESNIAMELYCPLQFVRGYSRHELVAFVHSDDLLILQMFREYLLDSWSPQGLFTQRVRLLRADVDQCTGLMVCDYLWQTLEVALVGRDSKGRTMALFMCKLDEGELVPLQFDAEERKRFLEASVEVSGTMMIDSSKSSFGTLVSFSQVCRDAINENEAKDDEIVGFSRGLLGPMGHSIAPEAMHQVLSTFVSSTLGGIVRLHVLLDMRAGVPTYQKSAALSGFGMTSSFRTYATVPLSGASVDMNAHSHIRWGYLKSRPAEGGGVQIGAIYFGFTDISHQAEACAESNMHTPSIWCIGRNEWIYHPSSSYSSPGSCSHPPPASPVEGHDTHIILERADGGKCKRFKRTDIRYTRTGGVVEELYEKLSKSTGEDCFFEIPFAIGKQKD